ncbi:MAG: hypothetical protein ACYC0A_03910 [Lutibacter sp.]
MSILLSSMVIVAQNPHPENGLKKVIVQEVIQVSSYTYLNVLEDGVKKWIAVPTIEAKTGDSCYYKRDREVMNFESKELGRKFDSMLFLGFMTKVKSLDDFISIEELYKNKKQYSGKKIKVKGKITKYSGVIMGENWLHLEDGTSFEDDNDLTITCQENVTEGDVVIFEGVISVNKNFGSGYFYKVIMEDAVIVILP